jgi:hypothetical protein
MTWGNAGNVSTTNLDSGTDSPAAARADIKAAFDELSNVINGRGASSGVAPLDASSKITAAYLPDEINSSSGQDLVIDPATSVVTIENIVKLTPQTTAQLNAVAAPQEGMIAFCSDAGDSAGVGIPVYYTGGQWKSMLDGANI